MSAVRSGPPGPPPWTPPGGAPHPAQQPWATAHRRRVLVPVLGMLGLALPGLFVLGVISTDIGLGAVSVGALAAVLPVIPVVLTFLWLDRWEPEPPRWLLIAFLWGASVSVLGAVIVNDTAAYVGNEMLGEGGGDWVAGVISAPLAEEAFKGSFLLGLLWWRRRELDGVVDALVYAGMVAAGFAFTENILYFGRAFESDGLVGEDGGVILVFVMRGLFTPFAHPMFTCVTGLAVGAAVLSTKKSRRVLLPIAGYLGAAALHAAWNASAGTGLLLLTYPLVMVPLFGGFITLIVRHRGREQRVVAEQLPGFATAGWIAPSEVGLLANMAGRRDWVSTVRKHSGPEAARAVKDYQGAVTELAFLRDRMARGIVGPEAARWHRGVLDRLLEARSRALNAPGALGAARARAEQPTWLGPRPPLVMHPAPAGPPAPPPHGPAGTPPPGLRPHPGAPPGYPPTRR